MKRMVSSVFIIAIISCIFITPEVHAESVVRRISGQNRYETAASIAREGWESSEWAVIANGDNFPDALSAAPLAAKYNAPILLNSSNGLRSEVRQVLNSLNVKNVFIIGGVGAISEDAEKRLKDVGIECERIAGQDRYETSVKIAEKLKGFREIAVATGDDFPDALSIAPAACKKQMPIILVPNDNIPECVDKLIKNNSISHTYVIGDSTAVSFEIEIEFPWVERIGSVDRYFTNLSVEQRFTDILNSGSVYITSGQDFPDGLSGSVLAAMTGAPIKFLEKDYIKQSEYIFNKGYNNVVILGNTGAIGKDVEGSIKRIGNIIKREASRKRFGYPYISNIKSDGDWTYYYRKDFQSDDILYGEASIYRVKSDGTKNMRIAVIGGKNVDGLEYEYILSHRQEFKIEKSLKDFYIDGEWLYYTLEGDEKAYKVKKDGTE